MGKKRGSKDRTALANIARAVRFNEGNKDDDRIINLWCAVLSKAIHDGLMSLPGEVGYIENMASTDASSHTVSTRETIFCRKWILEMRHDFCIVCDLALYEPEAIKDHFKRQLPKKNSDII